MELEGNVSLTDILYPECHLDSPLVTGKLIQALEYANLTHNQYLKDKTLLNNIQLNKSKGKRSRYTIAQEQFGNFIKDKINNLSQFYHVPYPECNYNLFRLSSDRIVARLSDVLKVPYDCYLSNIEKLLGMLTAVDRKLGGQPLCKDVTGSAPDDKLVHLPDTMKQSDWYMPFLFWFTVKTELRLLQKESQKVKNRGSSNIVQFGDNHLTVVMNPSLVTIWAQKSKQCYYLTPEHVLMFCDVLEGRLMIDVTVKSDDRYKSLRTKSKELWELIDPFFPIIGNETYNIVSMLEPFTLATLQLKDRSQQLRGAFLHHCIKDLKSELVSNGFTDDEKIERFCDKLVNILNNNDIHMIAEMFSFFRTFGHPTLEAVTAASKVRDYMKADKVLEYETIMKGHAIFCGIIINGYRDKHGGVWPPLTFPKHVHQEIKRLQSSGERLTYEICIKHWKSFCGLNFKCFMDLNLDEDLSMYMKDKALAAIRNEWDSVYPKENLSYQPTKNTTPRRLVDYFINDEDFDPYSMLQYVINGDYLNDPDFNVSYSLKEKETKEVGRLFAKMTYKMRACQVMAESLIAHGVGKFFKENGMVKDEQDLLKSLFQMSISGVPRGNIRGGAPSKMSQSERKMRSQDFYKCQVHKQHNASAKAKSPIDDKGCSELCQRIRENAQYNRVIGRSSHNSKNKNIYKKDFFYMHYGLDPRDSIIKDLTAEETVKRFEEENNIKYDVISSFLTTDYKKFCLNWRHESVAIFARRMDEIYGLPNFFNWMHKILDKSTIYVADPNCPPSNRSHVDLDFQPDDHIYIVHPKGGIEGYSQKLWTIITIPFLFLSAYETGTRIAAVVQGDNQSIAITTKVHPSLPYKIKKEISASKAKEYFYRLRDNLRSLGHDMKATETVISTNFFIYSKRIYYDGVMLSQGLKTISRCVFWSETLVDETRSACSNISTAITKSIENGIDHRFGFCLNYLKTMQQLSISLNFSINETITDDIKMAFTNHPEWYKISSMIPAALGGFNYLNVSRLYVRNIGDVLVASLADIKRYISNNLLRDEIIQKIMTQVPGTASYLDWGSDPYSANIPHMQSITKMIKTITAKSILSNSKNPLLKGLFHSKSHEEDNELAAFLMDRSIIIPRAAHEIIDNSVTGAREQIAGLLDTTKGLIRSGLRKGGIQPKTVDKIANYDYQQFIVLQDLLLNTNSNPLIDYRACSIDLAVALRTHMWRSLAKGREIYGLEVPDPLECSKGVFIKGSEECSECISHSNDYTWFFVPRLVHLDQVTSEMTSIRVPYIGSTTEERSDVKLGTVKNMSRALKAAVRIATVYTWAFGSDDQSWDEACILANQRANIQLEVLKTITPIATSNNLFHRLRDKTTQFKFAGSVINRVSRYVTISNDNINFKAGDEKQDTNFIFQQSMLLGLSHLEKVYKNYARTGSESIVYHLHVESYCCIRPTKEIPYCHSLRPVPLIEHSSENVLIYDPSPVTDYQKIKLEIQYLDKEELDFTVWSTLELQELLAESTAYTIIDIITKSERDHLKEFVSVSSDDNISSLITEFLLVDPELFSYYLGMYSALKWSFDIHYRRPRGKNAMVEIIRDLLNQASRHSYKVIANALSHPRVLKKFINSGLVTPSYGPYVYQQDFYVMSQNLLISSYNMFLTKILNSEIVRIMIAEQDENVVEIREKTQLSKYLCLLIDLYAYRGEIPWIVDLDPFEKAIVLENYLFEQCQKEGMIGVWNITSPKFSQYRASVTYLRRSSVKQLRIRQNDEVIEISRLENDVMVKFNSSILSQVDLNDSCFLMNLEEAIFQSTEIMTSHSVVSRSPRLLENHMNRRIGINSTSCYKAVDLTPIVKRYLPSEGRRLFLGEGSGAMMYVYQNTLGPSLCYYNSGVTDQGLEGQRELKMYPAEYYLCSTSSNREEELLPSVIPLFNGRPETTWIGNIDAFRLITEFVNPLETVMTHSDMESGMTKDEETILVEHSHIISLHINLTVEDSILVSKIAFGNNLNIMRLFKMYRSFFSLVIIAMPISSNPQSSEIYLICLQKLIRGIITPQRVLGASMGSTPDITLSFINLVEKIKMKNYLQMIKDDIRKSVREPEMLIPGKLTSKEKFLLSIGFSANGPTLIESETGHDPGSTKEDLRTALIITLNELLNHLDLERHPSSFFQPYQVLENSRILSLKDKIAKKYALFILLYINTVESKRKVICNLKRGKIVCDFGEKQFLKILPKKLRERVHTALENSIHIINLERVIQKRWWKIVGYTGIL
ncbi:large protein [Ghana virus]|uniref:RNA-directed RNA polymerase L n=10 Tax=Paramyxoviridae TaxID=11158 RepID=H9M6P4_9MONO|nr:large protein [Ghana virus]AET43339.1 large protein [Ghana virus]